MKYAITFVLAFFLANTTATSLTRTILLQRNALKWSRLVHFTIINMSGKPREVHLRDTVISLPVAEPMPLQVPLGESIRITSAANEHVQQVITVSAKDEGRVVPVA